jgi:bacterioferritin-associated ferredoxin
MIVCLCQGVSEKHVNNAIADGARTRKEVTELCGAGGNCGGCHRTIKLMLKDALLCSERASQVAA